MHIENPGGRPRKYANDAEKARAMRERWGSINVRCEARTRATLDTIAAVADYTIADIVNAAIKYYALNYDGWRNGDIFGGRLPTVLDPVYAAKRAREDANREFLGGDDGQ